MPKAKAERAELEQGYTYLLKGYLFIAAFLTLINPYDVGHTPVQACLYFFVSWILKFGFMLSIAASTENINDVVNVYGKQNSG